MRAWLIRSCLVLLLCTGNALAGTLLVVGDSTSAAFGMDTAEGWVALLEKRLAEQGYVHRVVNASVSGETSAGGASRLPALLAEHRPSHVLIELGGNDGLRGQSLEQLQQNLAGMVEKSQAAGAKVLLLGMQLPPNYGPRYTQAFAAVYPALGERYRVPVLPFLLEGVGGQAELMQADGIHPRSSAQPRLLENVWPLLQPLL